MLLHKLTLKDRCRVLCELCGQYKFIYIKIYLIIPEKPINASVKIPAVMRVIGAPLRQSGTSASFKFSRIPAIMHIAIVKPIPAPKLSTTASMIESIPQRLMNRQRPSIARV